MRRPSKTPKIIKNYKFAVYPQGEIPEEIWTQARDMNAIWNDMVEVRENFSAEISELYRQIEAEPKESPIRKNKAATVKEKWRLFDLALIEISKAAGWKEKLNWESREFVLENFRMASVRAFKDKGKLKIKSRFLENIVIPHRYSNGGWETSKIFTGASKKLYLKPLPQEVFENSDWQSRRARLTSGIYGFGHESHPLLVKVLLHREIPSHALVKMTQLTGTFDNLTRSWKWHLILVCQMEKVEKLKPFKPVAALDLGYRRIGDYLRIGYLLDTSGNQFELRLPLVENPSRRLKNTLKTVNNARKHQNLPMLEITDFFPVSIGDVWEWVSNNALFVEETKEKLKNIIQLPDFTLVNEKNSVEILQVLNNLQKVRRTGLLKLWKLTTEVENEYLKEIHDLLQNWKERDLEILKKIKKTQTHLINKRNKQYENLVLWLTENYSHLIYRKNLSLKSIAETAPKISLHSEDVALKKGAKYRQFANLSFLRQKLAEHDSNEWLIANDAENYALKCHLCGAICEPASKLMIVCPEGHEFDQDFQACRNFLNALPENLIYDRQKVIPIIPPHLKNLIVPV